jgi:hypothetical protein
LAADLIEKHAIIQPLRTLESIQLAAVVPIMKFEPLLIT